MINYKFHQDKKKTGYNLFANLTEEQDKNDSGNCRPLGRWHNLGEGTGMAIAAAKSEEDIYKWAFNWTEICDCKIVPVLTDAQSRKIISEKPDFETKLKAVREALGH